MALQGVDFRNTIWSASSASAFKVPLGLGAIVPRRCLEGAVCQQVAESQGRYG